MAVFRSCFALAGCTLLAACYVPVPETVYSRCDAVGAEGWTARVERRAQPNGRKRRMIVVSGRVSLPSAGYAVSVEPGPIERTEPRALQVLLRTNAPSEAAAPAVTLYSVEGLMPYDKHIGLVRLRCGDGILAEMARIEPAA